MTAMTKPPYALFEEARKQGPNPFRLEPVIADKEVWGEIITNLPSLNQHIDKKISQAISEVRDKYSSKIGIAIKGDRGTGKSHVIHRIWKTIEQEGKCVFAYIPPFSNASRINSHVRFYLSHSFNHQDIQGITQWQRLATAAITTLRGTKFEVKYRPYLERCTHPDELRNYIIQNQSKNRIVYFFEEIVEAILEEQPEIDYDFLKAILFLLFKNVKIAQVALAWIRGEDHPDIKKVGLPEFTLQQQEEKSVRIMQQICKLAEVASLPVLICFDQLDSARADSECGDGPAETVAKCIDQIYFQCSNVILLCCVISDTWREIEQMGSGIRDRVGQWSATTKPPTAEQMIELVKLRLDWFYKKNNLTSHDYPALYPFKESQIREIASQAAGARSLLNWCADKFDEVVTIEPGKIAGDIVGVDTKQKREKEFLFKYNELLKRTFIPMHDDDKLATIIACTIKMIPEGGVDNVVVNSVATLDTHSHDLNLIVSGYDSLQEKEIKIGLRVSETTNSKTFIAVMERLLNYRQHKITRGCLVRSTSVPLSWKKGAELKKKLVEQQGGEVVVLKKQEIKPLAAIQENI